MTHARTASATRHSTAPHRHQCPRTPQDHQAGRDIGALGRAGTGEFCRWLEWQPAWELRWLSVQSSGQPAAYLYHITDKPDPKQRYTMSWDPDRRAWPQGSLWQRVP
jgi:hypothetical protein